MGVARQVMSSRRFIFILFICLFWSGIAHAVNITVRLVYLKNGKPAQAQQIMLYEGDPQSASTLKLKETTSSDGIATFQLSEPLPKTVWVYEDNGQIIGCAWENQIPLEDVMKQGVTIGVDERFGKSCKGDRSAIMRLGAKPGEIVIFVRNRTISGNLSEY
jgi:hypothetical protein